MLGSTPKTITRAREGSHASRLGNAKKENSFDGVDMPEICKPKPKVRPAMNCVVWRARNGGSYLEKCAVKYATSRGRACALIAAAEATSSNKVMVATEGYVGL